jgi:hypothetical protein
MQNPTMGSVFLLGADSDVWENPDSFDLVALKRRDENSYVSRMLSDMAVGWYHYLLAH